MYLMHSYAYIIFVKCQQNVMMYYKCFQFSWTTHVRLNCPRPLIVSVILYTNKDLITIIVSVFFNSLSSTEVWSCLTNIFLTRLLHSKRFLGSAESSLFLDPVVQSVVSLTISLRHKFVKQISAKVTNTLLFFVKRKM